MTLVNHCRFFDILFTQAILTKEARVSVCLTYRMIVEVLAMLYCSRVSIPHFRRSHYLHNTRKRHVSGLTIASGNHINQIPRSLCTQEIYYARTPLGTAQWNVEREERALLSRVCCSQGPTAPWNSLRFLFNLFIAPLTWEFCPRPPCATREC